MFSVFLVCSGLAALVNVCVGYLLYGVMGFSSPALYALSVAAAFLSGMGVSFFLNRRYTFEPSGRSMRSEAPDFLLVSLGGLGLTTGLAVGFAASLPALFGQEALFGIPVETVSHIAAVGLTAIYSFLAHKYISFRRGPIRMPLRRDSAQPGV